ncbi:MAG: enoyl-CoA hydratase/isomerase family protein [Stellaceae bacterium]
MDEEILFTFEDGLAQAVLNRPAALNALTLEMCRTLDEKLAEWQADPAIRAVVIRGEGSRAFCAGGDIRKLYDEGRAGGDYPRRFYRAEYRLNARLHRFSKPYIAFLDGIVMGGGVGVSVHGRYRIATENTLFAMPETGIGLFPDVGGSYFLSRLSGALGMYLGLSGARLGAADAIYAGVAQTFMPAASWQTFAATLRSVDADTAIGGLAQDPGTPRLAAHRAIIDRCFARDSVEEIMAALAAEPDAFAAETRATLAAKSPTSLKLTHRQITAGRGRDFLDCMRMEWRMVNRVIAGHDFYEGTRAAIIDKDQSPRWRPARLEEVTETAITAYFAPLDGDELTFPSEDKK